MSDQNLEYTLDIGIGGAEKSLSKFFDSIENRMQSFEKKFESSFKSYSSRTGSNPFSSWEQGMDKIYNLSDKLDLRFQKLADTLRGSGAEYAARDIEKLRTELMHLADSEAMRTGLGGQGEGLRTFSRDSELKIQQIKREAREEINAQKEVNRQSDQSRLQRANNVILVAKSTTEANALRYKSDTEYSKNISDLNDGYLKELTGIANRAQTLTKDQLNAELQAAQTAYNAKVKLYQSEAQIKVNSSSESAARMGKFSTTLFQVQQTVEDFSYAGLRGASNNLAFMASQMGGSGGVIAMVGLLGLNFLHATGALEKLDKELGVSESLMTLLGRRTQEQIDKSKEMADYWMASFDAQQKAQRDLRTSSVLDMSQGEINKRKLDNQVDIDIQQQRLEIFKTGIGAIEDYQAALKGVAGVTQNLFDGNSHLVPPKDFMGNVAGTLEQQMQFLNRFNDVAQKIASGQARFNPVDAANFGVMDQQTWASGIINAQKAIETFNKSAGLYGFSMTAEAMAKLKENTKEAEIELQRLVMAGAGIGETQKLFDKAGEAASKFQETLKSIGDFSRQQSDTTGMTPQGADIFRDQMSGAAQKLEAIGRESEARIRAVEASKQTVDLFEKELSIIEDAKKQLVEKLGIMQQVGKVQGDVVKTAEEEIRAMEKKLSTTERLLEAEKERRATIAERKSAFEDSVARRQMNAADKIDDLKLGEASDAAKNAYEAKIREIKDAKSRYLQQIENQAEWMKRQAGKGTFNGMSAKDINQMLENEKDLVDRQEQGFLRQEEARQKARMAELEKQNEASKLERLNKLKEQLGGKAQEFTQGGLALQQAGNFDKAQESFKMAQKALAELQQAQEKIVGKLSSKQAEQIEKDLEGSSKKILQLFNLETALSNERTAKLQADQAQQQTAVKELIQLKEEAAEIPIYSPDALFLLDAILDDIKEIGRAKAQVGAIPLGMGGALAGGVANGAGNMTFNMNMGPATPLAAMAAAKAMAASAIMQRA